MAGDIGRYSPETARWVIATLKRIERRLAQFATVRQMYSLVGAGHDQDGIKVKNVDSEDAPAFCVFQAVDTEEPYDSTRIDNTYIEVQRPTDQYGRDGFYLINGPSIIPADGYGTAYDRPHCRVLAEGSGSAGDRYIPIVDEWKLDKDVSGPFVYAGPDDSIHTDVYRFRQDGGEKLCWFTTPGGGIPASSSGTYGKATCTLRTKVVDGSGNVSLTNAKDCSNADITHIIHNAGGAVGASIDIEASMTGGLWETQWEDCNSA